MIQQKYRVRYFKLRQQKPYNLRKLRSQTPYGDFEREHNEYEYTMIQQDLLNEYKRCNIKDMLKYIGTRMNIMKHESNKGQFGIYFTLMSA